ncbi:MAG TPA: response regulator [Geobacterales bacterium]|nr:response regulator [Geobacterales bacterium]
MAEPRKQLGEILVENSIITSRTLDRALERQRQSGKRLGIVLEEMGVVSEDELADALAQQFGFKTIKNLASYDIPNDVLDLIPRQIILRKQIIPIKRKDKMLALAMAEPLDPATLDYLYDHTGLHIVPVLTTRHELMQALARFFPSEGCGKAKILVVDDSPAVTELIQRTLMEEGYHVLTAQDGLKGLRMAIDEQPDLIICDCVMPRMDGYGMMESMKVVPAIADIPVILLTSKASSENEQKALGTGFIDFVSKPVDPVRVISRVKRAFELTLRNK